MVFASRINIKPGYLKQVLYRRQLCLVFRHTPIISYARDKNNQELKGILFSTL